MVKISKRFEILRSKIQKPLYSLKEGLVLLKSLQSLKFCESVEAHISLNINTKDSAHQLKTSLIFPHGIGKRKRIAVFTELENVENILNWGADVVGNVNLINQIQEGKINFDVLLVTPELMPKLTKFAKILGPKSLMPSLKTGTITTDLENTIKEFKNGKIEYRNDKNGIIHLSFGTTDFNIEFLYENIQSLLHSIEKNKPLNIKGKLIKSFYLCTTMSPSLKIDLNSLKFFIKS